MLDTEKAALLVGPMQEHLATFPDNSFDSCVCDPPYELGFMGKGWDSSGVAFSKDTWAHMLRVLKPGGHMLTFGGTRTMHRITCAIEDAGFEIRDMLAWLYGSGFPKSHNLPGGLGTALKPAHEPICLARKPLEGTVAENFERWGVGVLHIDKCRIASSVEDRERMSTAPQTVKPKGLVRCSRETPARTGKLFQPHDEGRWPANLILDGEAGQILGEPARFFYCPKPSRSEREAGCEDLPTKTGAEITGRVEGSAGLDNPRSGTGRHAHGVHNHHPTVKPIALMRYLCRLVTPPGGTVLDPFAGSGTTGVAAVLERFSFMGIELLEDHAAICEARIRKAITDVALTP
jgi:DNA modification methylase